MVAQEKIAELPPLIRLLLASLVLVLMLLMSYQTVYCLYHIICWSARLLSGLRVMFFSVPEIVNGDKNVGVPNALNKVVDDLKLKFESDIEKLTEDLSKLQLRNYEIEREKMKLLDKMSEVNFGPSQGGDVGNIGFEDLNEKLILLEIQYEKLSSVLQQLLKDNKKASKDVDVVTLKEKVERLSSEFLMWRTSNEIDRAGDNVKHDKYVIDLMKDIEQIKETIGSSASVNKNAQDLEDYLAVVLEKFPVLSSIGEKLENFETRTSLLEEKIKTDVGLIIEKHSKNLTENMQTKILTQVEILLHTVVYFGKIDAE